MPVIADVEPLVLVALVGVALLVTVIAIALVVVARVLREVSGKLEAIVSAVGEMPQRDLPPEDVLNTIDANLKAGQGLLEDLPPTEGGEKQS
jgi:hypothetical protein